MHGNSVSAVGPASARSSAINSAPRSTAALDTDVAVSSARISGPRTDIAKGGSGAARQPAHDRGRVQRRALPRPVVATAIFCVPLLLLRLKLDHLTMLSLAALLAGSAAGYGLLLYLVVLEPDERARINQLLKTRLGFA